MSEGSSRDILFHQETMPADIAESFETLDDLRRTMYEDFVIEQRQRGNISLGRAAELLGISYQAFYNLFGEKGLSYETTGICVRRIRTYGTSGIFIPLTTIPVVSS
ncbi:MAG: hypothetical protein GY801_17235 [bacterium]|nr:hypothetical protein [bacterium]